MRAHAAFAAACLAFASSACHREAGAGDRDAGAAPTSRPASSSSSTSSSPRRSVLASDAGGALGGGELVALTHYSDAARQLVEGAQALANDRHHASATTLHLLARYLAMPPVAKNFHDVGAEPELAQRLVEQELARAPTTTVPSSLSPGLYAVLTRAEHMAGSRDVSIGDLIAASIVDPATGTGTEREGPTAEQVKVKRVVLLGRLDRYRSSDSP